MTVSRRGFLSNGAAAALLGATGGCAILGEGSRYPGWRFGELDIHFIHTGAGESTFFIFPDGTTMLLDCGYLESRGPGYADAIPLAPSGSRRAGEWLRRYIERLIPQREIDYLMFSHWHSDHVEGLPDILESFRFRNYFDHQYPKAGAYSSSLDATAVDMVKRWLPDATRAGMKAEPFKVGAFKQIDLQHDPKKYFSRVFSIRNLAANGVVWDGKKGVRDIVGDHLKKVGGKRVNENSLSAAMLVRYGNFKYFTGGDLEGEFVDLNGGKVSLEAAVGAVAGPVEVCKTNHHGYYYSMCADFVRSVRPKLYLSSTWSPNQVNDITLSNMASRDLYPGERTIAYGHIPSFKKGAYAGRDFMKDIAPEGHVVVKVVPGGFAYRLYTLATDDESMRVVATRDFYCC